MNTIPEKRVLNAYRIMIACVIFRGSTGNVVYEYKTCIENK